jgi:adenylate kinase
MLSESIVVGLYGIQGVGKSYLLKQIAKERIEWLIVDGSQLIRDVLHAKNLTMEHFEKHMSPAEKANVRKEAIKSVKKKPGVVLIAGHCSFPCSEELGGDESIQFNDVFTEADGSVYDLIVYLEKPVSEVRDQVQNDKERVRSFYSSDILQKWVDHEKSVLEVKCMEHDIRFRVFCPDASKDHHSLISMIVDMLVVPACAKAKEISEQELIASIKQDIPDADVYLLIDGDGTLCAQDTGEAMHSQYFNFFRVSDTQSTHNCFGL